MHFRSDEDIGPLSPLAVSLAAGFSGSIAAAASHSFDTAKSRSQCVVLPKVFHFAVEQKTIISLNINFLAGVIYLSDFMFIFCYSLFHKVVLIGFLFFITYFVNHV